MQEHGPYSREPFERAFGSWSAALQAAGFNPYRRVDTDAERRYYGSDWPEQRLPALERDGWECQDCGMTDEEHRKRDSGGLHVHHETPLREFEDSEAANRLENLVTLCRACHSDRERET
jgi:5-methylcytosine-specific restriction endonuclease McrA